MLADAAAAGDVFGFLLRAFSMLRVSLAGSCSSVLGGDAGLQLAAALELGVELRAEQQATLVIHSQSRPTITPASEP